MTELIQTIDSVTDMLPLNVLVAVHEHADPILPFAHALCLALMSKGAIEIIDVRKGQCDEDEISVRGMLAKWGVLPENAAREDVGTIGLKVKKIIKPGNTRKEIASRLAKHNHDILIIGVEENPGVPHLFGANLIEYLINVQRQTTLYIPQHVKPFVTLETGQITLRKVIVPIAAYPPPEFTLIQLQRIRAFIPSRTLEIIGVHAGDVFPSIPPSVLEGFSYKETLVTQSGGSVAEVIAKIANDEHADLIAMSTNGRDTIPQKIMGSITEHVVRKAPCPVLAIAIE